MVAVLCLNEIIFQRDLHNINIQQMLDIIIISSIRHWCLKSFLKEGEIFQKYDGELGRRVFQITGNAVQNHEPWNSIH